MESTKNLDLFLNNHSGKPPPKPVECSHCKKEKSHLLPVVLFNEAGEPQPCSCYEYKCTSCGETSYGVRDSFKILEPSKEKFLERRAMIEEALTAQID